MRRFAPRRLRLHRLSRARELLHREVLEAKGLLVVVLHVEAATSSIRRTAAMYGAGPQQKTTRSARSGASSCSISALRKLRNPGHGLGESARTLGMRMVGTAGDRLELTRKDDVVTECACAQQRRRRPNRGHTGPRHGHDGRIPSAPGQEEVLRRLVTGDREDTEGPSAEMRKSGPPRRPVRHKASRLAFDGDTQEMGTCRRRGDRVTPADGAPVDLQLQVMNWPGSCWNRRLGRLEEEGLDVVGDVLDLPTDQRRAVSLAPHGEAGRATCSSCSAEGGPASHMQRRLR